MSKKQSWLIEFTMSRIFDGTEEAAEQLARDDFNYYLYSVDGGDNCNVPSRLIITEFGKKNWKELEL